MSYSSLGLILGRERCAFFQPVLLWLMCLIHLGHHWEEFYKRSSWPLARSNQSFLAPAPPFVARETLRAWQEKNHPWLELSDVHRETTENIRVTVIPFYMGMRVGAEPWYLPSRPGPQVLCGVPSVTAGMGPTFKPCA